MSLSEWLLNNEPIKTKPLAVGKREISRRRINRERSHAQYLLALLECKRNHALEEKYRPKPKTFHMTDHLKGIWGTFDEPLQIYQITAQLKKLYGNDSFNASLIVDILESKEYIEKTNIEYHKAPERAYQIRVRGQKRTKIPVRRLYFYYPTAKGLRVINPKPTDELPTALRELK